MDAYAAHLAMAALVGASLVAVSAYYMHRKTLTRLLEFAKTVERDRDDCNSDGGGGSPLNSRKQRSHERRQGGAAACSGGIDGEERRMNGQHVDGIPSGLPRLQALSEGKSAAHPKISGSVIRQTSPKSPIASASAYDSVEGSDEEDDLTDHTKLETSYLHSNGNAAPEHKGGVTNGEQLPLVASTMLRSHSVSGDLHGVQPDPIAADILRREPEQETFTRLKITPTEVPSPDEVEVYLVLQECLERRKRYIFREAIAPWEKEVISDPGTPKANPDNLVQRGNLSIILRCWTVSSMSILIKIVSLVISLFQCSDNVAKMLHTSLPDPSPLYSQGRAFSGC